MIRSFLVVLGICLFCTVAFAKKDAPSFYELEGSLVDERGQSIGLDFLKGQPVVATMFYATCPHACPMLIAAMKSIDKKLSKKKQKEIRYFLISFDVENDKPKVLKELRERHKLDKEHWILATPKTKEKASEIANVLGVKYRQLPDGGFSHSSILSILDKAGRIVFKGEALNEEPEKFVEQVGKAF